METQTRIDRIAGTLFGTAIGDALGLFVEGLPAHRIERYFGRVDRFLFPFGIGILSDDTEQSALVGEALMHYNSDPELFETYLRWLMVKWFWTLPPGVGSATAQACIAMTFGSRWATCESAGNGAAMRAALIGVYFANNSVVRKTFGYRAARITHANDDSIDGALYVAELAAACTHADVSERLEAVHQAVMSVPCERVHNVIETAMELADRGCGARDAARNLGCSGYVLHTIGLATFCFLRYGDNPKEALIEIVGCGGDTDSNAAVLGAWLGAMHGKGAFPQEWLDRIMQGPIDLDKLSRALAGEGTRYGGFNYFVGLARNLVLIPYVLCLALFRALY